MNNAEQMVNLQRYPITEAGFIARCRQQYLDTGLCALTDFILPQARQQLAAEASAVCDKAYFCNSSHNAYLTEHGADFADVPADDIARRQEQTYVGSVPYDQIGTDTLLRRLYLWDPLKDFIGAVLGKARFYRFADPLGACSINVFVDGGRHGWHFDESEFTVTLMLQPPTAGGSFEYVPQIRGLDNEKAIVAQVLEGDRGRVVELPFTPGTLLIFGGRQTLHRVTEVRGPRPRLVPVLCYAERPNLHNSAAVRQLFWGRTGQVEGIGA